MTASRMIDIATIDAGGRLRALDLNWVTLLADEISRDGQTDPIRVVERGEGFKLVSGARRLAAVQLLGRAQIEARIEPASALADEASIQLAEIKSDMLRGDLTVLDRARYIAAWREIYETVHTPAKRGRKPTVRTADEDSELSAKFALNFSDAAQVALQISRRSVFLALEVASIPSAIVSRIGLLPIADKQSDLLLLAKQSPARQTAIVDMLTAEPATAASVMEALASLDSVPTSAPLPVFEKMYQRFCTLKPTEKFSFFDLNADEIERWQATRSAQPAGRALKSVA